MTTTLQPDRAAGSRAAVLTVEDLTVVYEADPPVTAVRNAGLTLHRGRSSAWPASPGAARPPWRTRSTGCTDRRPASRPAG